MKPPNKQKWSFFFLGVLFCAACFAEETVNQSVEQNDSKEVLETDLEKDEVTTKPIDESDEAPPKDNPATIKEEPTVPKKEEKPVPEVKKDTQPGILVIIIGILQQCLTVLLNLIPACL